MIVPSNGDPVRTFPTGANVPRDLVPFLKSPWPVRAPRTSLCSALAMAPTNLPRPDAPLDRTVQFSDPKATRTRADPSRRRLLRLVSLRGRGVQVRSITLDKTRALQASHILPERFWSCAGVSHSKRIRESQDQVGTQESHLPCQDPRIALFRPIDSLCASSFQVLIIRHTNRFSECAAGRALAAHFDSA